MGLLIDGLVIVAGVAGVLLGLFIVVKAKGTKYKIIWLAITMLPAFGLLQYLSSSSSPLSPQNPKGHTVGKGENMDPSLLFYLPLDGNLGDYSGHNNNGTAGYTEFVQDVNGQKGALRMEPDFILSTQNKSKAPPVFSISFWIKSTSNNGGKIIGFESNKVGVSNSYDRHFYMNKNGRIVFGVWIGKPYTLVSPQALNDGNWHFVTGISSPHDFRLYVDNESVGSNPYRKGANYLGYWRIGSGNLKRWTNFSNYALTGDIDEVRIYNKMLSRDEVSGLYAQKKTNSMVQNKPEANEDNSIEEDQVGLFHQIKSWLEGNAKAFSAISSLVSILLELMKLIIFPSSKTKDSKA